MRVFLAGIMQGSQVGKALHDQGYRGHLKRLLSGHFPEVEVYDPLENHGNSLAYDRRTGREVFFEHNLMCREIDVLLAFVPEASMGTAIEMWEAHQHGAAVVTISPLRHNWAVKHLSHALYADLPEFEAALRSGRLAAIVRDVLARRTPHGRGEQQPSRGT
jgi:hypothetical protein